jgi:hypothetical protein
MAILIVILFVLIFGGAIGFAIYSFFHRRDESFTGIVIDKDIIENQVNNNMQMGRPGVNIGAVPIMGNGLGGGIRHTYRIKVKTDVGKEIHYTISEGMYEIIKIGDHVSKAHGTTDVTILGSTQPILPTQPTEPVPLVSPTPLSEPIPPTNYPPTSVS